MNFDCFPISTVTSSRVHLQHLDSADYPENSPYHPGCNYPEYPFNDQDISTSENVIYEMVRQSLLGLELDKARFNTSSWNPLEGIVNPGDTVLVKPNMVLHVHKRLGTEGLKSLVTHTSFSRAIIDYIIIALKGNGRIVLGDAPIQYCDFDTLSGELGYNGLLSFYRQKGMDISLVDFRLYKSIRKKSALVPLQSSTDNLLNEECLAVDVGHWSRLQEISHQYKKFRVTKYDPETMLHHHTDVKHEYLIHKAVLAADVVINLPKLKTHRKVGLTCALKNMVGINGIKDCLPHHTRGAKSEGGDEYLYKNKLKKWYMDIQERIDRSNIQGKTVKAEMMRKLRKPLAFFMKILSKDPYKEGSWYGNDTIWRTCLDLNTIVFYADKKGKLQNTVQRRYFALVDGVVAGDGEGPLRPTPRQCGFVAAGFNPVVLDAVLAQLVGFDFNEIPLVYNGFLLEHHPLAEVSPEDVVVTSNHSLYSCQGISSLPQEKNMRFTPSEGWKKVLGTR